MIGGAYFAERRQQIAPEQILDAPNVPGVFLVHAGEGQPYLARTALLRRRLNRLLRDPGRPSRLLNLTGVAKSIDYWLTGSRLESNLLFYSLARHWFPEHYLKIAKLRMPAYIKLTLANPFPRTHVTTRPGGGKGFYLGPFRTRASAEQFEAQALEFFQVRRCQENLEPRPDHPGCIYGEMGMCLRPCQEVVNESEYASEVVRLQHFFATGGQSLLETAAAARDRWSEELQFEEAARQHKRYEKIEQVLGLRDELVDDLQRLNGVAITPASGGGAVTLWFMVDGVWAEPVEFSLALTSGSSSIDQRLREIVGGLAMPRIPISEKQEHVAILSAWYYSSWRDGEWLNLESLKQVPYRKLVNAIARTAKVFTQTTPGSVL